MAMAVPDTTNKTAPAAAKKKDKEYQYGQIKLSLDNCIFPSEMLDETPSMKDGMDRDTENELRRWGCELIQVSGLLLKLPQTAMATGQVILQRFYYIKSVVHHDVETCAMACVFLAAKIEESPRKLRDVINVWDHIKQRMVNRNQVPTPMDYYGTQYLNVKNNVIKSERRILKELGFCVHVKHPHKIIITYLQLLDHEKNVPLARSAWNFMNDSLRTDVFVRFSPDIIACACIFLAARTVKVNLPLRPPWWLLFDASYDDIEDICTCILRLYKTKPTSVSQLETTVKKLKEKKKKDNPDTENKGTPTADTDSFTPTHTTNSIPPHLQVTKENNSKPSSKNSSPVEKEKAGQDKRSSSNAIDYKKMKAESDKSFNRESDINKRQVKGSNEKGRENDRGRSRTSSSDTSESETELPSKKYEKQREQYETKKRAHPSGSGSDSDKNNRITKQEKPRDRVKEIKLKESNGKYDKYDTFKTKRSRSRSPDKRGRSASPKRKIKHQNHKTEKKSSSKVRHVDKYSNNWR